MSTPQAYLTNLQGQVIAKVTPNDMITLGQKANNTIVLDDFSVSAQHGAITYRNDRFTIERWSRGAIWVNDAPVEGSRPLNDNDRILIGKRHAFIFRLGEPESEPPPAHAPDTVPARPSSLPEISAPLPAGITPEWARAAGLDEPEEAPPQDEAAPTWQEPASVAQDEGEDEEEEASHISRDSSPTGFLRAEVAEEQEEDVGTDSEPFIAGEEEPQAIDEPTSPETALPDKSASPTQPTKPPIPVPEWVTAADSDEAVEANKKITPPEGVSALPSGWQQELEAPAPTVSGSEDWGTHDRGEARRLIQDAIQILRYGDTERARQKLNQALRINESNEDAWLWLAAAERDPERRQGALQRVLTINPNNPTAKWGVISLQTLNLSGSMAAQQTQYAAPPPPQQQPTYQPPPISPSESIPALLRAEKPVERPGMAMLARLLVLAGVLMLSVAFFMDYGVWTLSETIRLWFEIPPPDTLWTGLQIWGYLGIAIIVFTLILLLLIRARQQRWMGILVTIIGLGIIFMGLFPPLFAIVTNLQLGAVIWGAAGLPLMLAGLLKIW